MKMKKVLITGASGFIGGFLVDSCFASLLSSALCRCLRKVMRSADLLRVSALGGQDDGLIPREGRQPLWRSQRSLWNMERRAYFPFSPFEGAENNHQLAIKVFNHK